MRGRLDTGLREVIKKELEREGEEFDLSAINLRPTHIIDLNLLRADLTDDDMKHNEKIRRIAQEYDARVITPVSIMSPSELVRELCQCQVTVEMPLIIGYLRRPVYYQPEEAFTCKLSRSISILDLLMKSHFRHYLRAPPSLQDMRVPLI